MTTIRRATNAPLFGLISVTGAVTFQGLTLEGGRSSGANGSAIQGTAGIALTSIDVVVKGHGGAVAPAIVALGTGPVSIRGSIFRHNTGNAAGAIQSGVPLTIEGTLFDGNEGRQGTGGGVYSTRTVEIAGSADARGLPRAPGTRSGAPRR